MLPQVSRGACPLCSTSHGLSGGTHSHCVPAPSSARPQKEEKEEKKKEEEEKNGNTVLYDR
eukprot:1860010-Pyramimonas_sp.AAC.1